MNAALLTLDAIEPAVSSYVAIWTPLFEGAKAAGIAPEWLLHWGHGGAMATVLFAMGGYGAFLGWQTRFGNGDTIYPLTLGETARELHPKLMGAALFFFLLGGQGGLVLLATAGQPILQSAHSSTAVIGIALLIAQAGELSPSPSPPQSHAHPRTSVTPTQVLVRRWEDRRQAALCTRSLALPPLQHLWCMPSTVCSLDFLSESVSRCPMAPIPV